MPMINVEYDNDKVKEEEILTLSNAIQKIVSKETKIEDVFVYTNNSQIKIKVAPIEIFFHMSASIMENHDNLIKKSKSELQDWKKEHIFQHNINLTLIPMNWDMEIGI